MLYESLLVFAVLLIAGWTLSVLLQQQHDLYRQAILFFVIGLYFVWFWTHGGQTLAMKTWHLRLVASDGGEVKLTQAISRYLLAWFWVLPGLAVAWALGAKNGMLLWIPAANILIWALTSYLDPQRQFLHDRIAGTRLVSIRNAPKETLTKK